jgi:hypothetical protein
MSIILNFLHFKTHIIMKLNLKAYWREILIGILIALLIWISSSEPKIVRSGSSDTTCIVDTVTNVVPGATMVKYVKVKLPFIISDTVIGDTVISDRLIVERDTSWLYTDVPMNEYKDTSYYIRTIGWLDSVSVYLPKAVKTKSDKFTIPSLHINTQMGPQHIAPGATLQYKKVQVGYNYNIIQGAGNVTLGYKIF